MLGMLGVLVGGLAGASIAALTWVRDERHISN
jgi:hypothetical protein